MYGRLQIVSPPQGEPIHTNELMAHLVIEDDALQPLARTKLRSAWRMLEQKCKRMLVAQTWDLALDYFPGGGWINTPLSESNQILLPLGKVQGVTSLSYVDGNGVTQSLTEGTHFQLDNYEEPARLAPAYNTAWPDTRETLNAVVVRYVVGDLIPLTVDTTTNVFTANGASFSADRRMRLSVSGGHLPQPLALDTDYFVINPSGSTFQLAATSGGAAIDITTSGSGYVFAGELPADLKDALLQLASWLFEHRGEEAEMDLKMVLKGLSPLYNSAVIIEGF